MKRSDLLKHVFATWSNHGPLCIERCESAAAAKAFADGFNCAIRLLDEDVGEEYWRSTAETGETAFDWDWKAERDAELAAAEAKREAQETAESEQALAKAS